jgi:probable rRNA maturation factor
MINFIFIEDTKVVFSKSITKKFIKDLINSEHKKTGDVNFVFCSDDYLLDVNKQYLNHDYYTDIITFDYCEGNQVSGDIFISVDRVLENSQNQKVDFNNEFYRVLFHGVLHLCGYKDKKKEDKTLMTSKEDFYLNKFNL